MIVSEQSSSPRTLAPAGTHIARCVRVIDLGTQDDVSPQYGARILHKMRITWELPHELHTFDEKKGEEPFFISKKYTVSLSEKANLRKDLESWRGRQFTEDELRGFDLKNILGAACQISIIHKKGEQSGKVREAVTAVTPMAKGMTCPPAISEVYSYDVEDGENETFQKLHKFLQEEITKCHEWRRDVATAILSEKSYDSQEPDLEGDEPPF